jgi:hypothetical protein
MSAKPNLQFLLSSNQGAMRRLIDDVTDDESLVRGKDDRMHIRWQTGHIVYNAWLILRTLGVKVEMPDGWYDLYKRGCDFAIDGDAYPSMDALRKQLYAYYDQINAHLAKLDDAELEKVLDPESVFKDVNALNTALFFCTHEFYHAGQIASLRRILGRDQPFG